MTNEKEYSIKSYQCNCRIFVNNVMVDAEDYTPDTECCEFSFEPDFVADCENRKEIEKDVKNYIANDLNSWLKGSGLTEEDQKEVKNEINDWCLNMLADDDRMMN